MTNYGLKAIFMVFVMISLYGCGKSTDTVESGTYQGTIDEVNAEETEIYVEADNGKRLELYFTDETTLTSQGENVEFSELQKGQRVEVELEKVGKRLDPLSVKILE